MKNNEACSTCPVKADCSIKETGTEKESLKFKLNKSVCAIFGHTYRYKNATNLDANLQCSRCGQIKQPQTNGRTGEI